MHELTASEAAVLLSLLCRDGREETAGLSAAGVPVSTFYATRRKIYDAGWVSDRYVPNPWTTGFHRVDCVLAQPGPSERTRLEREWGSSGENVLLWSGLNLLFGVFFHRRTDGGEVGSGSRISITADKGALPVYFDYSRLWSRFTRIERETGYARSPGAAGTPVSRSSLSTVHELTLADQKPVGPPDRPHRWHSSAGLSRRQQQLLDHGDIRSRTFLNLDGLPPFDSRALGEIIFLTGAFRKGVGSQEVLAALTNECRVSPLLVADDVEKILIIALGQVESAAPQRTKVPRAAESVTSALDARLGDLQMLVEHAGSLRQLVDHRYDRLFSTAGSRVPEDADRTP